MTEAIAKELHLSGEIKRALKTHGKSFTPDAVQYLADEAKFLIGELEGEISTKSRRLSETSPPKTTTAKVQNVISWR